MLDQIKALRVEKGLTQAGAADAVGGLSGSRLASLERGQLEPKDGELERILKGLKATKATGKSNVGKGRPRGPVAAKKAAPAKKASVSRVPRATPTKKATPAKKAAAGKKANPISELL